MKIDLIPYTSVDGIATFGDTFIKELYNRMVFDNTAGMVFYDGSVQSSDAFLRTMKFNQNALFILSVDDEISGIVWLNNFEQKSASFHFCFFSNIWGKDTALIGKKCFSILLDMKNKDEYLFDLVTGIIPVRNKKAIKWAEEIGAGVVGKLPLGAWIHEEQRSEDAIIFYVERGRYHG